MNKFIIATVASVFFVGCGGETVRTEYVYVDGGTKIVYVYPDGGASGAGGSAGEPGADAGEDAPPESGGDAAPDVVPEQDAGPDADAARECVTDDDCAQYDTACLVFRCNAVGTCDVYERDGDGDGRSLCGGNDVPGWYDCDDSDPSVRPDATEVCGDFVDQNCNGEVDEGCWSFCKPMSPNFVEVSATYQDCCEESGSFPLIDSPTVGMLFTSNDPDVCGPPGSGCAYHVYYMGSDGKRYIFPLVSHVVSWFGSLDSDGVPIMDPKVCGLVSIVPINTLASIPLGEKFVSYRPGTFLTGTWTDPKRYAIAKGGILRKVADAVNDETECPAPFTGSCWKRIRLEPDYFLSSYILGTDVTTTDPYDVASELAVTIEQDLGLVP